VKKSFIVFLILIVFLVSLFSAYLLKKEESPLSKNDLEVITNGVGVNIKRDVTEEDIETIADAGFKWVRVDITWEKVETKKGQYNFEDTGYDDLNKWLKDNNLKPYYILNYSNNLYEEKRSIVTERGRNAFTEFASAAAQRYSGQGAIWEIWNEPNFKTFWDPQPSYNQYAKLVKAVSPVVKKQDKSGIVVAPAVSGLNKDSLVWLESLFKENTLNDIDAVSVHPYRYSSPESISEDYMKLKKLIGQYTDKNIPILSGEWGYSMVQSPEHRLTEGQQANYLTRMFLINAQQGVPISIWYNWKNNGGDLNAREQNFGVLWYDSEPKLSYLAIQTLTNQLEGYHFSKQILSDNNGDYILEFKNSDDEKILAYWTTNSNHNSIIKLATGKGKLISMLGAVRHVEWGKSIDLKFLPSPSYLVIE
jgi:aryl-phospho-beta-D-glucosidase BglC (GH1 family)